MFLFVRIARACYVQRLPHPVSMMDKEKIKQRLFEKRKIVGSGCWIWTGYRTAIGYGETSVNQKGWRVHRLAYTIFVGPIPEKTQVCHTCDTPACFNPVHLWLGTARENRLDALKKGRDPRATKTSCVRGHPYAIYGSVDSYGWRHCMECGRLRHRPGWVKIITRPDVCKNGHELNEQTLRIDSRGYRRCKICAFESIKRRFPYRAAGAEHE